MADEEVCDNCDRIAERIKPCKKHGWNGCTICGNSCLACGEIHCPWCKKKECKEAPVYISDYDTEEEAQDEYETKKQMARDALKSMHDDPNFKWPSKAHKDLMPFLFFLDVDMEEDPMYGKIKKDIRRTRKQAMYCFP